MPFPMHFNRFHISIRTALISAALATGAAWAAGDYDRVQSLQASGQTTQAMKAADDYIAAHPNDPQMRFIKANLLITDGQASSANDLLMQLTDDYPELAEPWNNLAVLYARNGELQRAEQALKNALRIQPDYATALENQGDIQTRLALQSYEKALAKDRENAKLKAKINVLETVDNGH